VLIAFSYVLSCCDSIPLLLTGRSSFYAPASSSGSFAISTITGARRGDVAVQRHPEDLLSRV
jgi:hypothetical protein